MPDVIIKGMEMPRGCYSCPIGVHIGLYAVQCPITKSKIDGLTECIRLSDCPLRPAPGWISVEERLPETNGRYIVAYEDATSVLDFFNGKWFFPWHSSPGCIAWEEEGTIQAWMPFPELPEVSE